jgi:hypothetical protein
MHHRKKAWILLISLALLVKIFSFFPNLVERYYSRGIYPLISGTQRWIFGWLPFSIGDLIYSLLIVFLIYKFWSFLRTIFQKKAGLDPWKNGFQWMLFWTLWVYTVFNLFWGLNYNRIGAARQLGLSMRPYNTRELKGVILTLVDRLEQTGKSGLHTRPVYESNRELFSGTVEAYREAAYRLPFLSSGKPSLKPSLFSYLGDYLGYTGYYNPFTGEAQVNTTIPVFLRPFTSCHELGHQLGYAKENEANFAGYLAARSSPDTAFRYSVYFDLYSYGIRELFLRDSLSAKTIQQHLPDLVKKDFRDLNAFFKKYENPLEPVIWKWYGKYLRANEQPSGMESYSEVMAFLVASAKKYGLESL